jgi:hypothetical protein
MHKGGGREGGREGQGWLERGRKGGAREGVREHARAQRNNPMFAHKHSIDNRNTHVGAQTYLWAHC